MTSGIYAIVNTTNDHRYIGSSANIKSRWRKHISLLIKGAHHSVHLQRAWNIRGRDSFAFIVLLECAPDSLLKNEQEYIDTEHPEYNICVTAGNRLGVPHSEETRLKLAIANIGRKQTQEVRERMSASHLGKHKEPKSEEHRRKIGDSSRGRWHTEEDRQKISAALKGKQLSEKNKQGISAAMIGNQNTLGKHWKWKKNAERA